MRLVAWRRLVAKLKLLVKGEDAKMQPLVRKTLSCWLFVGTIIIRPTLIEASSFDGLSFWG